jgi:hypothetical protein
MNDNTTKQNPQQRPQSERTPIQIARLLITAVNPSGVEVPHGPEGKSVKRAHTIQSGMEGDIKTEIDHRPWLRVFRVTKMKRTTRTGPSGKEIESYEPMGRPFHIPDSWAISEPVEE